MADTTCPPLGIGSVDFNALHDAAKRGNDLTEALAAATVRVEPEAEPAPAPEPEAAPAAPAKAAKGD